MEKMVQVKACAFFFCLLSYAHWIINQPCATTATSSTTWWLQIVTNAEYMLTDMCTYVIVAV